MGTSSSGEVWTAKAHIYSGLPNPEWVVDQKLVSKLMRLWDSLQKDQAQAEIPARLGYRGVSLRGPENRSWHAYDEIVRFAENDVAESRVDQGRKFEKMLLSSAPAGLVPPSILNGI